MTDNTSQGWGSRRAPESQPSSVSAPQRQNAPAQLPRPIWPPAAPPPPPRPPAGRLASPAPAPIPPPRRSGCGRLALMVLILAALAVLGLGVVLVGYASIARDLPQPDELQARASHFASTLIYDRNGDVLNEVGDPNFGRRTAVPIDQIAPYLRDATIATEDPNFYQHPGVDPVGLLRAVYYAVRDRSLSGPGGSTITQQLVKLTFLSAERTFSRKVKEAILAAELTRRYPKDTILQIYLNEIYYGNLAYGVEAAAETYFGKTATNLTLAEAAMLAGLPQAPAYYDPYTKLWDAEGKPGAVKRRQGEVLRLMVAHGAITPTQADAAWAEPLHLKPLQQVYDSRYPHFVQYARSQVEQTLGPQLTAKGGLRIYTTLDPRIQEIADGEVKRQVAVLAPQNGNNAAAVVVRPATGELLALVGSADFNNATISGQINMALAPRQPGSAIKPFTYLAAFEMPASIDTQQVEAQAAASITRTQISAVEPPGYWTPATAIMDIRTEFPDGANPPYVPVNYDGKEHGLVSVRTALANSYNIPAVKALEHVGLERLKDVARRAGITTLTRPDYGLSLTLGGGEVTLLELTGAYATLANGGARASTSPIACVLDADGRLIWREEAAAAVTACVVGAGVQAGAAIMPTPVEKVFDPQLVYLITSILSDAEARQPMFGSAARDMSLPDRPVAVKTGTTNDYRDAWTLGYTPDLAVGVWVGNADYSTMEKLAGSLGAAPIWRNVMARTLAGQPVQPFVPPPGIGRAVICADSGAQPSEACPRPREELFAAERGPFPAAFDLWQRVRVDKLTGQLATEFTPADRIELRDIADFPERYRAWAAAHGYPLLDATTPYAFAPEAVLYTPAGSSTTSGSVPIAGRIHIPEPLVWRLEYGVGPNPLGWGVLSGPHPADPADSVGREIDGSFGDWDMPATAAQHDVNDLSLRLAVYDPANMAYPVAVSEKAYIILEIPTATPEPSPTPTPTPTPTLSATPTDAASPTPSVTPVSAVTPSATPEVAPSPSPTETPAAATTLTPTALPTTDMSDAVRAEIGQPTEGAQVQGIVEVLGAADGAGFAGYVLEYAAGDQPQDTDYRPAAPPMGQPVSGGVLAQWSTEQLPVGVYTLRLRVLDTSGKARSALVRVNLTR